MAEPKEKKVVNIGNLIKRLTTGQLISLGIMALAAFVLIISIAIYAMQEDYVPLFTEPLDAKRYVEVRDILENRNVAYKKEKDNKFLVPESQALDLRSELEAQNLRPGSTDGYSVLDETNPLKAGESIMAIQKLRAKESNLARYLKQNPAVRNAFVQITPAKDSPFTDEAKPAKASVMLVLNEYDQLSRASINGMQRYVAGAIESAELEHVVITDQYHRVLTQEPLNDETGVGQKNLMIRQEMEQKMVKKVLAVVEPILGPNKAVANVSLDINFDKVERFEKKYGGPDAEGEPQKFIDQQKQEIMSRGAAAGNAVGAVPNTVQGALPQAAGADGLNSQKTTNNSQFYVDELQQTMVEAPYDIDRISVALNLDYKEEEVINDPPNFISKWFKQTPDWIEIQQTALTQGEIDQITELVKASVGFIENRDAISIHNFKFKPAIGLRAQASMEMIGFTDKVKAWVPWLLQLTVFLLLFFTGVRMFKRFVAPILQQAQMEEPAMVAALPSSTPKTVAEIESEIEAELDGGIPGKDISKGDIIRKRVIETAQGDPVASASLIRTWLLEDD